MGNIIDYQSVDIQVKYVIYPPRSELLFIPVNPADFSTVLPITHK